MKLYTAGGIRQKMKSKRKPPVLWKVIVKWCVVILLGLFVSQTLFAMYGSIEDAHDMVDDATLVNWCNQQYRDREFADLSETLLMYQPVAKEFDKFWEMSAGYEDYLLWRQWDKALDLNLENSVEKEAYYRNKVIENVENTKFEMNKKFLKELKDKMNGN